MARYSLRSTARQLRVRVLATIGILAAIAVTWWMKVEDARNPDAPPQVALGEPVSVGRAVFTPQKLTIEPGSDQGERKLVLVGQLENVTSSSQRDVFGFPGGLPELASGDTKFPDPKVNLVRDNYILRQLEPRIRETVTFVWEVPQGWSEQDVSIEFSAQQFKLNDNLYAKASWLVHYPTGTLRARPEKGV